MSEAPLIVTLNFVPADANGHGGSHRAYQIEHELVALAGRAAVQPMISEWWREKDGARRQPLPRWHYWPGRRYYLMALKYLAPYRRNPLRIWGHTDFEPHRFSPDKFLRECEILSRRADRPLVCVAEHPGYGRVARMMRAEGIATIVCPQNLESLYGGANLEREPRRIRPMTYDLAREVEALMEFDYRLFISKAEAGLISGIGLPCDYHPYRPVGEIEQAALRMRDLRAAQPLRDVLLLLGSASNPATFQSMEWLLDLARRHGLPAGVRIEVVGLWVDRLAREAALPGVTFRGRVTPAELDELLVRTAAVLVPQRRGFGALTRLSELSLAGIPMLASRHPSYTMNVPPGVSLVEDDWSAWCDAMRDALAGSYADVPLAAYRAWESDLPSSLPALVRRLLNGRMPVKAKAS